MTNIKMLFLFLPLIVLACTLTTQSAAMTLPIARQTNPATVTPAPQLLRLCQVKTGFEAGTLNLRTCGGTYCPTATVLHEGEIMIQTEAKAVDGWRALETAAGVEGWAKEKYLTCEETK